MQLTCEVCGGTELAKQEGLFVCQTCGCKYSVEEVRKMMVGTAQSAPSQQIENKLKNAINEFENGNNDITFNMCSDILNMDPENYLAIIYKGLAQGWESSVADSKINITGNEYRRAIEIMRAKAETDEEYTSMLVEPIRELQSLGSAMFSTIQDYSKNEEERAMKYMNLANKETERSKEYTWSAPNVGLTILENAKEYIEQGKAVERNRVATCNREYGRATGEILSVLMHATQNIAQMVDACEGFYGVVVDCKECCRNYLVTDETVEMFNLVTKYCNTAFENIEAKEKAEFEERRRIYWEAHPEEMKALTENINRATAEANQLADEIEALDAEIEKIDDLIQNTELPLEKQKKQVENQIRALRIQRENLGLFKGKEKKILAEQIDSLCDQIPRGDALKKERDELRAQHQPRRDELREQLKAKRERADQLLAELEEYKEELNRDR